MSKKRWLIVPLCAVLCSQGLFAQTLDRRVLGIDEMFRLADENSQSIQTYKTGKEAADEALKAAKSQRLPDIGASLSFSYLGDGYIWDRDFKNGQNIPMPHFDNNFALEAQQVIYAGGAINSSITLAELGQQMAALDWQKNRQEIRFLLTGYYLDLYKLNNQLQVLQKNLDLTEQVIRNMESRRTQGTALKNDITRYELQKETLKLQLAKVQDARKIMNHQLVTTLHLPAGTEIVPDSTLLANMKVQQSICMGAPFYVLGPLVTDIAPGYDHITAAIGGAVAAMNGAAFLCYVTPAEHLALPNVEDTKQGIIASKIAAHAADIAKGIPGARDIDDKMADARRVLDWDAQFACALDPETAKAIRDDRLPEDDHSEACSMCGKFCAVRSMNKALAGEYIDIL